MAPENTNELATTRANSLQSARMGDNGIKIRNFDDLWRFAQCIVQSGWYPSIKTQQQAVVAIQLGLETGLPMMQALQNIAVINGRASLWGDVVEAMVLRSGLLKNYKETWTGSGETLCCKIDMTRADNGVTFTGEYSWSDVKKAGMDRKDTYQKHPKDMLRWKAYHRASHGFKDVLKGMHIRELVQEEVIDAQIVDAETNSGVSALAGRLSEETPDVSGMGKQLPKEDIDPETKAKAAEQVARLQEEPPAEMDAETGEVPDETQADHQEEPAGETSDFLNF